MTDNPLHIAFLWHMHQPYYKDPFTGIYRLPWVRLHGTKDYLDMVEILEDFPEIRQTFNLVPSLLAQLRDYTENNATDIYLSLTMKNPQDLTDADKIFMLENFFLANWDNMIRPFPRYYELLVKRGLRFIKGELARTIKYFTAHDFIDLQVLFNLSWIDPMYRRKDPFLSELAKKGKGYTEDEKKLLIEKQFEILKRIIPKYKELNAKGQIELSASPFYHPILPLLWDTDLSKIAMPHVRLPQKRFSNPEDAVKQIKDAVGYFEKTFGYKPAGMWPSEGSVSEDVIRAVNAEGIKWVATDEGILANSLDIRLRDYSGSITEPSRFYRPYSFSDVSIIFRDHKLSDMIGFVYSEWEPKNAADDLINRLLNIRSSLPQDRPYIVPIILDGENAWEHYRNDGHDFLRCLYDRLSNEKRLKAVTVSEFLKYDSGEKLGKLHAGSWINANYSIWIGHEEDNIAWDYLNDTRTDLAAFTKLNPGKPVDEAWQAIYVAEGSDWNWWYGDEHQTETQEEFDELFRLNLMKVYRVIGKEIPPSLFVPVLRENRAIAPEVIIRGFINPKIDGLVTSYYEWYQGAHIAVGKSGGSMHKAESLVSYIYYGFNQSTLFLRIDPKTSFNDFPPDTTFSINIAKPFAFRVNVAYRDGLVHPELFEKKNGEWEKIKDITEAAMQDILEIAIPFKDIKAKAEDELNLFITAYRGNEEIERCPWRGNISVTVPTPDFEATMWY
ncbi:MAG: glycoside hydrolase family 57 protein [Thermodesulfovibrionales bacterium]|nr:glycoside hydrolase family 57 protein [Thermodesulfovibrionales bacterium]